jgi:hypothetical protein
MFVFITSLNHKNIQYTGYFQRRSLYLESNWDIVLSLFNLSFVSMETNGKSRLLGTAS